MTPTGFEKPHGRRSAHQPGAKSGATADSRLALIEQAWGLLAEPDREEMAGKARTALQRAHGTPSDCASEGGG